jgi:hypothetical protein
VSDTPEHVRIVDGACRMYFGDKIYVEVHGFQFTLGQISALAGDFFASPEDFLPKQGFAEALARVQAAFAYYTLANAFEDHLDPRDEDGTVADTGKRDKLSLAGAVRYRGENFIQLAIYNQAHFVHGRPDARSECIKHHTAALDKKGSSSKPGPRDFATTGLPAGCHV